MDDVRDVLLRVPPNPRKISVEIAKRIWRQDYIKTRMLGPKTRDPRVGERSELISEREEKKIKSMRIHVRLLISCMIYLNWSISLPI